MATRNCQHPKSPAEAMTWSENDWGPTSSWHAWARIP